MSSNFWQIKLLPVEIFLEADCEPPDALFDVVVFVVSVDVGFNFVGRAKFSSK